MSRYKKYRSDKVFSETVDAYFDSISRTVDAVEMVSTGKRDKKGHEIYKPKLIVNDRGQKIRVREYVEPPTISGLCLFLNISRQTWANYCKDEKFLDTATRARARVEAHLEKELITRPKGTDGIKFALMENFGWREKLDVSGHQSVEQYLREHPGSGADEF